MSTQHPRQKFDNNTNKHGRMLVARTPLMNITLLLKRPRKLSILNIGLPLCLSFLAIFFSLGAGAIYGGYYYGRISSENVPSVSTFRDELEKQKAEVDGTLKKYHEDLNALALRLGQMQAHVVRLDAVGKRLVNMSGLDKGEFHFDSEPGQGGPEVAAPVALNVDEFLSALDGLSKQLEDRGQQLEVLENLLMNKKMVGEVQPNGWPISKGWISSYFGVRTDPFTGIRAMHEGIDFAGKEGSDVVAVASGVVTFSGKRYGYGNMVEITHGNGYVTRYAHNLKNVAKTGERIEKGQVVSLMGSSGRSTGPHVHFEVVKDGYVLNPAAYIQARR